MRYIVILLLFLSSCSAEWHLKRAVKLDPKYEDSSKLITVVIHHDTIHDTILVPQYNFDFIAKQLNSISDSFSLIYSDSIVTLYGKLDSLGNVKYRGKVKERLVPYEKIIHDTTYVEVKCPPSVTVNEGYPGYYFIIIIGVFFLILYLIKR